MNTLFWSFLANFGYLRLILGRKSQKNTFSNYLGAKRTIESKKVGPFGYFKNRAPKVTQKPPWAKKTLKRPQEGQNWHQCFSCGPTNYFWAKKNKFESDPSEVCSFHVESAPTTGDTNWHFQTKQQRYGAEQGRWQFLLQPYQQRQWPLPQAKVKSFRLRWSKIVTKIHQKKPHIPASCLQFIPIKTSQVEIV